MKLFAVRSSRGFTLIELLIVIALLGALAVGLIGAIDPFEQLKKGADTGTRDLVNQVQTAIIRYYSVKNNFPWCPTGVACSDPSETNLSSGVMSTAIQNMVDAGELNADFAKIQSANLGKVFVTGSSTANTAVVCYTPSSKSFRSDPNTKFTKSGADYSPLPCTGSTVDCYWCIR